MSTRVNEHVVTKVSPSLLARVRRVHSPFDLAEKYDVDVVADPHQEDDAGNIWTFLSRTRDPEMALPGREVICGIGSVRWRGKVLAWDFEVSDDDPIVVIEFVDTLG